MFDFSYDVIFLTLIVLFIFMKLIPVLSKKYSKHDAIKYILKHRKNYNFRDEILNIYRPQIGEIVEVITTPWDGMFGYVTRMNDEYSYNIKITRTLNPFSSYFPKNVIRKDMSEVALTI
jgi:hypothetical protein